MTTDPIAFPLILFIALIIGIFLWFLFFHSPFSLIIVSLFSFVVNIMLDQEAITFHIGRYSIYLMDIFSALFISLAIARITFFSKKINKNVILVILLGVLLFVSWLRGTFLFNLETSTNMMRTYLYFYSALFYMVTVDYSLEVFQKFSFCMVIICSILIAIVVVRWILVKMGALSSPNWTAPNGDMIRVISSAATFLLLQTQVLIYYTHSQRNNKVFTILGSSIIIAAIIFLQHRTVWVVLLVTIFIMIVLQSKVKLIVFLGAMFAIVSIALYLSWTYFSTDVLSNTAFDLQTANWRILGWQELLDPERFQTPLDYFIGQPFGTSYSRYILNSIYETTVSPHNFYIQTFLNIGGIGLLVLLSLYASVLKILWNFRSDRNCHLFILLLSTQLVFFLTYAPNFEQGLIFGLAFLYAKYIKNKNISQEFNIMCCSKKTASSQIQIG